MTDPLERFAGAICSAVNEANNDGLVPQVIFDVMAATIAATARNLGAKDVDVFRLFTGFAYGYRALPRHEHATALREASPCTESALGMKGLRQPVTPLSCTSPKTQGGVY